MSILDHSSPDTASRRSLLKSGLTMVAASAMGMTFNLTQAYAQRGATLSGAPVDLGSGDFGILNYAYALEQLEAAFYTTVVAQPYGGMTSEELSILSDIKKHEIEHREFFKGALGANAIPNLEVNFSKINFNSRKSVLNTAKTFEDLGVSAYNGAGYLLQNVQFLAAAGTIVSVEARHAAIIRDMLSPLSASFAGNDVVNGAGLDVARSPSQVLPKAGAFIATPVSARALS